MPTCHIPRHRPRSSAQAAPSTTAPCPRAPPTCHRDRRVLTARWRAGCVVGRHSTEPPAEEKARREQVSRATADAMQMHAAAAKPDSDGRAPPPSQKFEPSAPKPKKREVPRGHNRNVGPCVPLSCGCSIRTLASQVLPEGQARCRHYGCQQVYSISQNGERACVYHCSAPLFHEGSKQWPCCNVKKW